MLARQPSITWNGFQAITNLTNHPCYYYLHISRLMQGCTFHAVSWLPIFVRFLQRVSFSMAAIQAISQFIKLPNPNDFVDVQGTCTEVLPMAMQSEVAGYVIISTSQLWCRLVSTHYLSESNRLPLPESELI